MVTHISTMGCDVGLILLKVLSRSLLTCRCSVKRIRIKQTWGALMFVFDFALLVAMSLG